VKTPTKIEIKSEFFAKKWQISPKVFENDLTFEVKNTKYIDQKVALFSTFLKKPHFDHVQPPLAGGSRPSL
jgi:hypothetical protein